MLAIDGGGNHRFLSFFRSYPYRRLFGPRSMALRLQEPFVENRIVIACPTLVAGGAERQIVNTALGLRRRGVHDLTVLVTNLHSRPGHDFFYETLVSAGIDVRELEGPTNNPRAWAYYSSGEVGSVMPRLQERLRGLPPDLAQEVADVYFTIRSLRPAVVHAWLDYSSVSAGLAALLAGVPRVLLSGRNVSPVHFPHFHQSYMRPAYQAMAQRPQVVLINNSRGGAADYSRWLGVPLDRFKIIYNGLDPETAIRASDRAITDFRNRHRIPLGSLIVGGMFRLSDEKRPILWVETLARIVEARKDVYGLLFGSGPLHAAVNAEIERARLTERIHVSPPTAAHALALSAFDVLLLTSRWEGTPNVVIEAQSVATPVVSCGGGGAAEALSHGETGLYVESAEPEKLATAVLTILSDHAYRLRLGAAGPRFAQTRFGFQRMIAETLDLYALDNDGAERRQIDARVRESGGLDVGDLSR
jgi:glycosyltransferase involved in cell wall biosynthesis